VGNLPQLWFLVFQETDAKCLIFDERAGARTLAEMTGMIPRLRAA
jgi:hypothetical protein